MFVCTVHNNTDRRLFVQSWFISAHFPVWNKHLSTLCFSSTFIQTSSELSADSQTFMMRVVMVEWEVLNFYCNTLPSSDVSMNISRILMQDFQCSKYSEYYRQADPNSSNNTWKYMKLTLKQRFILTVCLNTLIQDQIHVFDLRVYLYTHDAFRVLQQTVGSTVQWGVLSFIHCKNQTCCHQSPLKNL